MSNNANQAKRMKRVGGEGTRQLPANSEPKRDPSVPKVYVEKNADWDRAAARAFLSPAFQAAVTVYNYGEHKAADRDINAFIAELEAQAAASRAGDMGRAEDLLVAQAHTLNEIFNDLARRAKLNFGQYLNAGETYLRLALKAQSQCRTTIESLNEIKNPRPVAFVKQANIANGHQQVNNGPVTNGASSDPSRVENNGMTQSKLLEHQNGEWLDAGAQGAAGGADKDLATMGEVHRTEKRRRKAAGG